jgi:hypothetical protein
MIGINNLSTFFFFFPYYPTNSIDQRLDLWIPHKYTNVMISL